MILCFSLTITLVLPILYTAYNPYTEYSRSIQQEANEIMTIVSMFEARAEKRGAARGEVHGEARGIIKNGRRHSFSDDIIIQDLEAQIGCSFHPTMPLFR